MSWAIASSIFRMFSACCCSWLWVLNFDSFVTPSTSWATSAPKRSSTSVRLYSVSSGTSWRSAAWMAVVSIPSSARIWAEAIGCVTYGSPVARLLPLVGRDGKVERLADRSEVARRVLGEDGRVQVGPQGLEIDADRRRRRGGDGRPPRPASGGRAGRALRRAWCRGRHRPQGYPQPIARPVQRGLGLRTLVPGQRAVGADDGLFVALAGEEHDVARAGALEGRLDGGPAVGDDQQIVVAAAAGGLGAAGDRVEDDLAVLAARVLVGQRRRSGHARRRSGPSAGAWPCRARRPTRRPR